MVPEEFEIGMSDFRTYFDGNLYVNLHDRKDRDDRMVQELERAEVKAERFPALRFPECPHHGCRIAHLAAMRYALKRGWSNLLVFEDDVVFTERFRSLSTDLPNDWDLVYFGGTTWVPEGDYAYYGENYLNHCHKHIFGNVYRIGKALGTYAIAYGPRMLRELSRMIGDNSLDYELVEKVQQAWTAKGENYFNCYAVMMREDEHQHHWGTIKHDYSLKSDINSDRGRREIRNPEVFQDVLEGAMYADYDCIKSLIAQNDGLDGLKWQSILEELKHWRARHGL